jgi:monooxygenase
VKSFDVIVVGAGIAGIDAAYHLMTRCPTKTFTMLEARDAIGGTWDLFRYPGIRSDSDMYTLGFPFRPWTGSNGIAYGASILEYVRDTAAHFGIDRKIRFRTRVERAAWSTETQRWHLDVHGPDGSQQLDCGFLYLCTGYYDYSGGYVPELAGIDRFAGRVVHTQQWTDDIDYRGKRVVVIGSGATAVNLVPALAKTAAHVTMLQRSPSYVMSVPAHDWVADWLRRFVPASIAYRITRWKYVLAHIGFYEYCRRFPNAARRALLRNVEPSLGEPRYQPWDERLCFIPDGDLFEAIRGGRASVVTDQIESITERGLSLRSGANLEADLLILATGLRVKWFGGIELAVDNECVDLTRTMVYQGLMLSGVPNFAFATGYTTSSWTLRCDLTSRYICRLLEHMDRGGLAACTPRRDPTVKERPVVELTSGYVKRSLDETPNLGDRGPWRAPRNYIFDTLGALRITDRALQFTRARRHASSTHATPARRRPRYA